MKFKRVQPNSTNSEHTSMGRDEKSGLPSTEKKAAVDVDHRPHSFLVVDVNLPFSTCHFRVVDVDLPFQLLVDVELFLKILSFSSHLPFSSSRRRPAFFNLPFSPGRPAFF